MGLRWLARPPSLRRSLGRHASIQAVRSPAGHPAIGRERTEAALSLESESLPRTSDESFNIATSRLTRVPARRKYACARFRRRSDSPEWFRARSKTGWSFGYCDARAGGARLHTDPGDA